MKTTRFMLSVVSLFAATTSFALADGLHDDDRIFDNAIGAGVSGAYVSPMAPPAAVVKIETNYCKNVADNFCIVIGRGQATASVAVAGTGAPGMSQVSLDYDIVGGEFDVYGDQS